VDKGFFFPKEHNASMDDVKELNEKGIVLNRTRQEFGEGPSLAEKLGIGEEHNRLPSTLPSEQGTTMEAREEMRVPLREEEITARTHKEQVGEVLITKEVVTEERQISVPVQREVVRVERVPVSGTARAAGESPIMEGESVSVPVYEEKVDIEKRPVVKEEIRVSRTAEQEEQPVSTTVRREVAEVESRGRVVEEPESPPFRKKG
jgi:uncharacterized protein (TIGR02271 family)